MLFGSAILFILVILPASFVPLFDHHCARRVECISRHARRRLSNFTSFQRDPFVLGLLDPT